MATRRLTVLALLAVLAGCGSSSGASDPEIARIDREWAANRAAAERAVREGKLPDIALEIFDLRNEAQPSFIDGPDADQDLVRTEDGGRSGPPLRWDLNQDGRIDKDERRITERELYDATLRYFPHGD